MIDQNEVLQVEPYRTYKKTVVYTDGLQTEDWNLYFLFIWEIVHKCP